MKLHRRLKLTEEDRQLTEEEEREDAEFREELLAYLLEENTRLKKELNELRQTELEKSERKFRNAEAFPRQPTGLGWTPFPWRKP
jgi:hypothetical protein